MRFQRRYYGVKGLPSYVFSLSLLVYLYHTISKVLRISYHRIMLQSYVSWYNHNVFSMDLNKNNIPLDVFKFFYFSKNPINCVCVQYEFLTESCNSSVCSS